MSLDENTKHVVRGLLEVRYYSLGRDWAAVEADLDILAADVEGTCGDEVSVEEICAVLEEYRADIEGKEGPRP